MKCVKCGAETGANWKTLCQVCWEMERRERANRNYLDAAKAGNIQADLDYAEDSYYLD